MNGAEPPKITRFDGKKIMPCCNDSGQMLLTFGVHSHTLSWWKSNVGRYSLEKAMYRKISQEEYETILKIMTDFSEYYLKNR